MKLANESSKRKARKLRAGSFMQPEQFDDLMALAAVRKGSKNREGLRLVLLEGYTVFEAERELALSTGNLTMRMQKVRGVMDRVYKLQGVRLPPRRKLKPKVTPEKSQDATQSV